MVLCGLKEVGKKGAKYLNDNSIRYYISIRVNFYVENPRIGKSIKTSWMFNYLQGGESQFLYKIYRVNGQLCYLSASKVKNKERKTCNKCINRITVYRSNIVKLIR